MTEEAERINKSLERIKKVCKGFAVAILALLILFCLFILFVLGMSVYTAAIEGPSTVAILDILRICVTCVIVIIILITANRVLSDVAKGNSPFVKIQVRRLRRVALVLLVFVISEAILSPGFLYLIQGNELLLYYIDMNQVGSFSMPINLGALCASGGVFCLSLVFEYGVLLQKQSDETL